MNNGIQVWKEVTDNEYPEDTRRKNGQTEESFTGNEEMEIAGKIQRQMD